MVLLIRLMKALKANGYASGRSFPGGFAAANLRNFAVKDSIQSSYSARFQSKEVALVRKAEPAIHEADLVFTVFEIGNVRSFPPMPTLA